MGYFERDGVIRAADLSAAGEDARVLRDAAHRGELIRLRRGFYCRADAWASAGETTRHLLVARAVAEVSERGLLAGRTAAALHGIPGSAGWPQPVTLLVPRSTGGSSTSGVRRTYVGFETARPDDVDGLRTTTLARTAVDVARASPLPGAVAVFDAVRSRRRPGRVSLETLQSELRDFGDLPRAAFLLRALEFSTPLSDSVGESLTRVAIRRLGFEDPVLQQRFTDEQGDMWVDFFWPEQGIAVEFDGKVKYTDSRYNGDDPADVVWREKLREDRLRRLVSRFGRLVYADVVEPRRLDLILSGVGVPRRRGSRAAARSA